MTSKKTGQSQVEKFKQAARDLETDDDEKRFDEKLEKIARHKPTAEAKTSKKRRD